MLRAEWKGLLDELIQRGSLSKEQCAPYRDDLTIVGLVGSIDNDMSSTGNPLFISRHDHWSRDFASSYL